MMETQLWETRQTWGRDRGERKGNDTETGVTSTGDADDSIFMQTGHLHINLVPAAFSGARVDILSVSIWHMMIWTIYSFAGKLP